VYRAIDQFGQVIDVLVSVRRDTKAARRFFERAISATKVTPAEVVSDRAATYPMVLEELLPAAWHRTDRYANNRVECDHGRLTARLRPMRDLKQDYSARVIVAGHGFVQNSGEATTSWRLRSQWAGEWRSRLTSWSWRSDPGPRSPLQPAPGRRNATAPFTVPLSSYHSVLAGCLPEPLGAELRLALERVEVDIDQSEPVGLTTSCAC
jgi:hypothetical protein